MPARCMERPAASARSWAPLTRLSRWRRRRARDHDFGVDAAAHERPQGHQVGAPRGAFPLHSPCASLARPPRPVRPFPGGGHPLGACQLHQCCCCPPHPAPAHPTPHPHPTPRRAAAPAPAARTTSTSGPPPSSAPTTRPGRCGCRSLRGPPYLPACCPPGPAPHHHLRRHLLQGGVFSLKITFGEQYPSKAPRIRFTSEMFHREGAALGLLPPLPVVLRVHAD